MAGSWSVSKGREIPSPRTQIDHWAFQFFEFEVPFLCTSRFWVGPEMPYVKIGSRSYMLHGFVGINRWEVGIVLVSTLSNTTTHKHFGAPINMHSR